MDDVFVMQISFQNRLVEMVTFMHQTYDSTESRLKAEAFKQRVILCFRAWQEWNVYPPDFLIHLQNVFLGLASVCAIFHSIYVLHPLKFKCSASVDGIDVFCD